jgi:hypothetical protein
MADCATFSGMNGRFVLAALALAAASSGASACTKSGSDAAASASPAPTTTWAPAPATPAAPGATAPATVARRTVDIVANEKGFVPTSVELKKGEPTTLVFKRTTDETCAKQVVFPELKVTKELPLNQAVAFDVPVDDARTLTFRCGMGMFKGKVVVQ